MSIWPPKSIETGFRQLLRAKWKALPGIGGSLPEKNIPRMFFLRSRRAQANRPGGRSEELRSESALGMGRALCPPVKRWYFFLTRCHYFCIKIRSLTQKLNGLLEVQSDSVRGRLAELSVHSRQKLAAPWLKKNLLF